MCEETAGGVVQYTNQNSFLIPVYTHVMFWRPCIIAFVESKGCLFLMMQYVCPSKNNFSIDSYSVLRLVSFLSTIQLIRLLSACNISFFLISPRKDCDETFAGFFFKSGQY